MTRKLLRSVAAAAGIVLVWAAFWVVPSEVKRRRVAKIRPQALQATMLQAQPIAQAIGAYASDHGKPPSALGLLVPRYLRQLPDTGPLARDGWQYSAGSAAPPEADGWALWIWVRDEYSPQSWSFGDIFAYHPSGRYARSGYGGILERVGRWGYYHE